MKWMKKTIKVSPIDVMAAFVGLALGNFVIGGTESGAERSFFQLVALACVFAWVKLTGGLGIEDSNEPP